MSVIQLFYTEFSVILLIVILMDVIQLFRTEFSVILLIVILLSHCVHCHSAWGLKYKTL
jgi:hypothetical protein